jgi:hypothetical protein
MLTYTHIGLYQNCQNDELELIKMTIEAAAEAINFQVVYDQYYRTYLVRERANHYSFSNVPKGSAVDFDEKAKAYEQVRRLTKWQAKGNRIELFHQETPGCFEAVADTKYGCEW